MQLVTACFKIHKRRTACNTESNGRFFSAMCDNLYCRKYGIKTVVNLAYNSLHTYPTLNEMKTQYWVILHIIGLRESCTVRYPGGIYMYIIMHNI